MCEEDKNYIKAKKYIKSKTKSSLYSRYYAEACNEWRIHLRGLAPGQHSFEETSHGGEPLATQYPIRPNRDSFKLKTFHAYSDVINHTPIISILLHFTIPYFAAGKRKALKLKVLKIR